MFMVDPCFRENDSMRVSDFNKKFITKKLPNNIDGFFIENL